MNSPQPTGIFIPTNKTSLFILAFEKILLDRYNIITTFDKYKSQNSCEVQFVLKKKQLHLRPNIIQLHCKNAKKYLKEHLYMIDSNVNNTSKKVTSSTCTSQYMNDLVNVEDVRSVPSPRRLSLRSSSTIDLTGDSFQECPPEVIVLDDCLDHTIKSSNNKKVIDIIDLDETSKSLPITSKNIENDIEVIGIKRLTPSVHSSEPKVTIIRRIFGQENNLSNVRRSKRKLSSSIETQRNSNVNKRTRVERRSSYASNNSKLSNACKNKVKEQKIKTRKLRDVGNIIPTTSSNTILQRNKPLTDGVLKYYTHIGKAINKGRKSKSPKQKQSLNKVLSNKKLNVSSSANKLKAKTPTPQRKLFVPTFKNKKTPGSYRQQKVTQSKKVKCEHESNIFNPNPNVDVEGLRPVAIDGSNVAVGHGKGSFSTKGLKICVDYFVNQGHKTVKVFLPLHREDCFSKALLEELRSKCDMVFTPSRIINGKRTTSYDDRFIVQYAVEFGAVIVSTDNFRDLLAENPRWTKAIQKRLLMFTWIDDFLMFPMDPMGKYGPTLDQFLKF